VGSILLLFLGGLSDASDSVLVMLTRCGVKVVLDVCYMANATIFPAIFAGTAFGLCNMGGKFFTILAPMLAEVEKPVPMITFSIVAGLGIFASLMVKPPPPRAS
jgi:tetrahydromethanopterin S-methyltransferase subunit E